MSLDALFDEDEKKDEPVEEAPLETPTKTEQFFEKKESSPFEVMEETPFEIIEPKKESVEPTFDITVVDKTEDLSNIQSERPLTMHEKKLKIKQTIALLNYTAKHALNEDDFWLPPSAKGKALTRSGCNKLATIFNISTETIRIWVEKELDLQGNEDIVVYAKVKATRPDGSSVTAIGMKALSEYGRGASKMKMKDIKGTAETRAANRAIQNAIGFVPKDYIVVTKEEIE